MTSTPKKEKRLKHLLQQEKIKSNKRLKKLRAVRESKRRLLKKTAHLENILTELKCKMKMQHEELDLLTDIDTENTDFLKRFLNKANCPQKYSASLRKFALRLHFLSPKAYSFIRKQFDTCLPHPKTLYRWYKCIDCEPGFTDEAFEAIKLFVSKTNHKILCCISLDEMSIRQHLQWNGKRTVGYVNVGDHLDSDNLPVAKDALVFMVTALNASWKIPVGYFLTNGVNGDQRSALLQNCVHLLLQCKVQIVSVTFDGCPANFAMAKNLGAQFHDVNNIDPKINIEGEQILIIPDACHMLKLVRNTLADKKEILNHNKEKISWDYLHKLHNLQQNEGVHLANKLRGAHIDHKKQIMKVRLAAQTFSNSVAEALLFCKNNLETEDFIHSGATIEFIKYFNDIFDILNSRRRSAYGFKKSISDENFEIVDAKFKEFESYLKTLRFNDGNLVIKSGRKTGFLGFLICIKALRMFFYQYINIENAPIQYLCTYKMSQDHLEIFFSAIRSKGGFNNNPTALQFTSAYRRLLVHGELKNMSTGNCVPLDNINILTCNLSAMCRKINNRRERLLAISEYPDEAQIVELPESHDYIGNCELSEFTKEATIYIAGYIIRSMKKIIKCSECLGAIVACEKFPGFILQKDVGGLHYPSQDVIKICLFAEKVLRQIITIHGNSYLSKKDSVPKMICSVFKKMIHTDIFKDLTNHINDQSPLDNHLSLLIKAITMRYLEVRIHFIMCSFSQREGRIRNLHTKLVLFRGQ